jgi:DNA helicase-2/ATP-dependent DNA helicase PcrA
MRSIREGKKNGEEEERRLMYVAITRAEKALFLTESEGFNISSKTNKYPSRFLAEIKPDLVVTEGVVPEELWKGTRNLTHVLDQEDFSAERAAYASPFHVGDIVRHAVFGEGVIVSANKDFTSFDVQFDSGAIRTLRAGFIQLADLP